MGKSTSDADFLAALRNRSAAADASKPGMILHTPPTGVSKSLDELVSAQDESRQDPPRAELRAVSTASHEHGNALSGDLLGRMESIDLLDTHPWNARVHRTADRIREIASQIAATRQMNPIIVTRNPEHEGRYFVVDGETRFRGLKLLKRKDAWILEIDVDPSDPAAFYAASFKQTDATEEISAIDKGIRWADLIAEGHATTTSISEMLEVNQSTVSRMLAYRRFSPAVLEFMHAHADSFPYSIAAILAQLNDQNLTDEEILSKCQEVVDSQHGRRAVEALVKGHAKGDEKKQRKAAVVAIPIKSGASQVGSFRTYESGALEFKLAAANALPSDSFKAVSDVFEIMSGLISEGHQDLVSELAARLEKLRSTP